MKRAVSLFSIAVLLAASCVLSSCSGRNNAVSVLNISGAEISDELFSYYLGIILHDPSSFGLGDTPSSDEVTDCAVDLCRNYVAINTAFSDKGLRLTSGLRHEIAEGVSAKWSFYKNFYTSAGIGKQTLTKALTADAKEKMLFSHYYDRGGEREVPEDELKSYFNGAYVSFRAINGYLTEKDETGNVVPLPDEERELLKNKFRTMLSILKNGGTFDEVYQKYASEQQLSSFSSDVMTINKNNNNYPSGFFDFVSDLPPDSPAVFETKDYIFIVSKTTKNDGELLDSYRSECLKAMRSDDFENILSGITMTYTEDADSSVLKGLYNTVKDCY